MQRMETFRWSPVGSTPIRHRLTTDRKRALNAGAVTHHLKRRQRILKLRN
jgi:hypothetical protein